MGRADHTQQVAESILRFFPGFEAFKLSPPSVSEEVMKNINRNKSQIISEFFSGIEKFKVLLKRTLTPKHSFNDGELQWLVKVKVTIASSFNFHLPWESNS